MIQTFHAAIDINKYSVDQTGAKTQLGGLNDGKIILEYQGSLNVEVTILPINEALKVIVNIRIKDKYLNQVLEKDQNMPFIYSWNRADDLKNFGKGFVYKNYIDKKGEKFDGFQKLKNNFKPSLIPIWNKFSI